MAPLFQQPFMSGGFPSMNRAVGGWDVDDDFTSYADTTAFDAEYPTDDTGEMRGNPTSDLIDFDVDGSITGNQNVIYNDLLGTTIDDTAFVLRQVIKWDTITTPTSPYSMAMHIGIGDVNTNSATSQDFLGTTYWGQSATKSIYSKAVDGGGLYTTEGCQVFGTSWTTNSRYNEVIRTSATQLTNELFTDAYSTSEEKETQTIASTIQSLRYWKVTNFDNALSGQYTGQILASLQFADGVTVAP